jgi:hypothetical protein
MPSVPRSSVEDVDDVPLPPLDDEGDDAPPEGEDEELDGDYGGASDLDDSVAADLDVGIDIDDLEQALGEDGEAAAQLDVGALDEDLVSGDDEPGGDEEGHGGEEDDDLDELDDGPDDGGAEGTLDAIEDDVDDAALPALDGSSGGDDDGQHDDEALIGEVIRSAQVVELPARDGVPWEIHDGAGARVPCVAVVAHAGRALAGGDVLLLVDEGESSAKRAGLGWSGRAVSVAMADGVLAVGTARGAVSALAGEALAPLGGWRARGSPVRLAATPRRLWILVEERLYCSASDGAPAAVDLAAPVLAMAASAGTLLVLGGGAAAAVHKVRGDDETPARVAVPDLDPGALQGAGAHLAAAAAGEALAVGTAAGALRVSRDGGATFTAHHLPALRALAFAGDGRDDDLLALVDGELSGDDVWLLRVAASGAITRLLALDGYDEEQEPAAEAAALCWDTARELCWMASAHGLLAVGRATKH